MAHRIRFMKQVSPGTWAVQCRVCPKRSGPSQSRIPEWASYQGGRATFSTARECHEWWRAHEEHPFHQRATQPEALEFRRALRVHERQVEAAGGGWLDCLTGKCGFDHRD